MNKYTFYINILTFKLINGPHLKCLTCTNIFLFINGWLNYRQHNLDCTWEKKIHTNMPARMLLKKFILIVYFWQFTKCKMSKQKNVINSIIHVTTLWLQTASTLTLAHFVHLHSIREFVGSESGVCLTSYTKQVLMIINFMCRLKD